MLIFRKSLLSICEVWYDEPPVCEGVDLIRYRQRPKRLEEGHWTEFQTVHLDLRQDSEALFAAFKKGTRNEVRRALREGLRCEVLHRPPAEAVGEFRRYYERFARHKELPAASGGKLRAYADQDRLALSRVTATGGDALAWHAYYRQGGAVRLLFSASHFREDGASRQLVGRANRLLHWQDLLEFQRSGVTLCDLGGWYAGTEDQARLRINAFKKSFGGEVVAQYNGTRALTLKGRLALFPIRWLERP